MIADTKVGDCHGEALNIINKCGMLVRLDNTLSPIEIDDICNRLYHAQCHIMLDQFYNFNIQEI